MAVLTISRQMGSGGDEIARRVSEDLGIKIVDRERVRLAAEQAGVPRSAYQELTYEGERTLVEEMLRILQTVPSMPVAPQVSQAEVIGPFRFPFGGAFASSLPPVSSLVEAMEGYLRMVGMVTENLAREGNVLFLGQGGQVILGDHHDALHVLVVANVEDRVATAVRERSLSQREAARQVRATDRARADFLHRYYQTEWLDPAHYHLVLNTSLLSRAAAASTVVAATEALGSEDSRSFETDDVDGTEDIETMACEGK